MGIMDPKDSQPAVHRDTDTNPRTSVARPWNVIVWNDPVNLMSYVTYVFQRLFGHSVEKATQLMLEVHRQGKAIVVSVPRENAEYYIIRLHQHGLQATLEKVDD